MAAILVPSHGPSAWKALLAEPEKQWAEGYSAKTLAHCWEDAKGFPPEVRAILSSDPVLACTEPLLILPEWQVPLPGGTSRSQNDIWILGRSGEDLVSIAVEGKVEEPFGPTLGEWRVGASAGKETRLAFLQDSLGLSGRLPDTIRYQLLHRTASAVIEAKRFGAVHAVMLVHSFSPENNWFEDFAAFVSLFGEECVLGRLVRTKAEGGFPLHLGWVHGNEEYLCTVRAA